MIHFNHAGVGPLAPQAAKVITHWTQRFTEEGSYAVGDALQAWDQAREIFGALVGVKADRLAYFNTCASAISQTALGFPFKPGDEILGWDQEYPSNAFPWIVAAKRTGAKYIPVPSEPNYEVRTEKLLERIGPKTRAVAVSWVQYRTGATTDLVALSKRCKEFGTFLMVDGIQGLGLVPWPRDVEADAISFGAHKWMRGPLGLGFLAISDRLLEILEPLLVGTFSFHEGLTTIEEPTLPLRPWVPTARRFEPGSPNILNVLASRAALEEHLAAAGAFKRDPETKKMEMQSADLTPLYKKALTTHARIQESVLAHGFDVISAEILGASPILTFGKKNESGGLDLATAQNISRAMDAAKISHSVRANGIRLSPHGFHTEAELAAFEAFLRTKVSEKRSKP